MAGQFLHGIELIESDTGTTPVRVVQSSVIGIVGTAPKADPVKFPLDTPVLVAGSLREAAELGTDGTLPSAMDAIFDQVGAMVVVIRVDAGNSDSDAIANVIGGVDANTGMYKGVHAFKAAKSIAKAEPRILIAPGFTSQQGVLAEMQGIAESLRAVIFADGPNTTDANAISYREQFGGDRIMFIDPWVTVYDPAAGEDVLMPSSARFAGVQARTDNDEGWWNTLSNRLIYGITGPGRPVEFSIGDRNSRANHLNENNISTIIQQDGYRCWGNRMVDGSFITKRRIKDIVGDSLQRAHFRFVDQGLGQQFFDAVVESVNADLRFFKNLGAILGGTCWANPELNSPDRMRAGEAYFDFDLTESDPAEHITFTMINTDKYYREIQL